MFSYRAKSPRNTPNKGAPESNENYVVRTKAHSQKNAAEVLPPAAADEPRTARLIYTLYGVDLSPVALIGHRLQVNEPVKI